MKVNNFRKDLRKAENSIVEIAAAIDAYESGLIIFDECLQLIAEEYHAAGIRAAKGGENA